MSTVEIPPPTQIGPDANGMAITPEEFDAIPPEGWDENFRYELVRGILIVTPPAGTGETSPNDELAYRLRNYGYSHAQGAAFDDTTYEFTLRTSSGRRRADRVVWCGLGHSPDYKNDVPSIVIEFVADRARDRHRDYIEKRAEYKQIGVKEYWVIDRFRRTLTVYQSDDKETVHTEDATVTTPLLPGFELNLKRLLDIADRAAQ